MKLKARRLSVVVFALIGVVVWLFTNPESYDQIFTRVENTGAEAGINYDEENDDDKEIVLADSSATDSELLALDVLELLDVKGRAPKTGYSREQFYTEWPTIDGCNLRQRIIKREFGDNATLDGCNVIAGEYDEPYTGEHKVFSSRDEISKGVQIDHVVALSDAWQKGAQYLDPDTRYKIATDPLNLIAVDAEANEKKSDGDAATWLPSNKKFRCQYVARQVSVKYKYKLWMTQAEKEAIKRILTNCPNEPIIGN